MAKIEELKAAWYELNREAAELNTKQRAIEDEMAREIAASIGLSVGSIVAVKKTSGYGGDQKVREYRYRVESFKFASYGNGLEIFGRTIRKDGSEGECHEIWRDWEIVSTPEQKIAG